MQVLHGREREALNWDFVIKEPALEVQLGETFVVETEDNANGRIRTAKHLPTREHVPEFEDFRFNPCGGPIYVKGVQKGDVLLVEIVDINPDAQGQTWIMPGIGPLADSAKYPTCHGPSTKIIRHLPGPSGTYSDGKAVYKEGLSWDLKPFIGTIAVVPQRPVHSGSDSVFCQGPMGGNMDCRDISKGNTLQLPVFHDGAYLYLGDVHASQGDSEYYAVADECRADVTLRCEVVKNKSIPFARIEKPDSIVQINCNKPLEAAINQAFLWMIDWLVEEYGFDPLEAYHQMSINPDVRINVYQMVSIGRILFTSGVEFSKQHLT